ncbi:hypothetical protein H4R33_007200, partial [Dimargaris cristalligena]
MPIRLIPHALRQQLRSQYTLESLELIVQELISNGIDSGASQITIRIDLESCYVEVSDNGSGISSTDLPLLGQRYTSSRDLPNPQLLPEVTRSMQLRPTGFRGEALASLSHIALVELHTRAQSKAPGAVVILQDGWIIEQRSPGHIGSHYPTGTTVRVHNIFYRTPVRRKQLQESSPALLLSRVKKVVETMALIRPCLAFTAINQKNTRFIVQLPE